MVKRLSWTTRWIIVLALLIILASLCVSACTLLPNPSLKIVEWELQPAEEPYIEWEIIGIAENNGNVKLKFASIEAKFYDAEDNVLGTAPDVIRDLEVGERWNFNICSILISNEDLIDHAKLSVKTLIY